MSIEVEDWDDENTEMVEETISMLAQMYNLSPDNVLSALRRDVKIREYNQSSSTDGGRPNKREEYVDRMTRILEAEGRSDEVKLYELNCLFEEMNEELARTSRYRVRNDINKRYGVHITEPFVNMSEKQVKELLNLPKHLVSTD